MKDAPSKNNSQEIILWEANHLKYSITFLNSITIILGIYSLTDAWLIEGMVDWLIDWLFGARNWS